MTAADQKLLKRQRQLFVLFGLARGFIFWYSIEKLFQISIGITAPQIVLVGVFAQGSKLLLEIPTSMLADRWSRRNMLIASALLMIACCVILGLSNSMVTFIAGILFWSLSDAFSSGAFEAFVYDSLKAGRQPGLIRKLYARMSSLYMVSLAVAGLLAGIAAEFVSLRVHFFATIFSMLVIVAVLTRLPEPAIRRTVDDGIGWMRHIGTAGKALFQPAIRWPMAVYIALFGLTIVWYEYYQLVGIDLKLTPLIFSNLIGILCLGMAAGAELTHRIGVSRRIVAIVWLILLTSHLVGLRTTNPFLAFFNLFLLFGALRMMHTYLELYIQSKLASAQRATILSFASTASYAWFFGLAFVFSLIINRWDASWALTIVSLPVLVLGLYDIVRGIRWAAEAIPSGNAEDSSPEIKGV